MYMYRCVYTYTYICVRVCAVIVYYRRGEERRGEQRRLEHVVGEGSPKRNVLFHRHR